MRLKKIWSSNSINRRTKVMLYKTAVKPVLIYGCETWKMNKSDENKIDVFQSSGPFLETTDNFPGPVSIFSELIYLSSNGNYWHKLSDILHKIRKIKI